MDSEPRKVIGMVDVGTAVVITGKDAIALFGMLQLRGMLKLEVLGMSHSKGVSAYAVIKKKYNLKGSKKKVLEQYMVICEKAKLDFKANQLKQPLPEELN